MKDKKKYELVWQYYASGSVVFVILAVLAAKLMSTASYQITAGYITKNPLLSISSTYFVPANKVLWDIQFRWTLVILMALSIIVPLVYVYLIKNNYKKIDLHKYRFIDWTITGTIILLLIAIMSGASDIMTLVLIAGLSLISYYLFWTIINNQALQKSISTVIFKLGVLSSILPWILILFYVIGTLVYGGIRSPWYIYVIYLVGLLNTAVIIYAYKWHKIHDSKPKITNETYPILINQAVKVLFVLVLIIGLKR